jgi:hypothetical protein
MKRSLIVLAVCALNLVAGVQLAAANTPPVGAQTADQSASSEQAALAASGAAQLNPSNTNVSIRVLSPGDDGSVTQTNSVDSDASASNENSAEQDATQEQSSGSSTGCCPSGTTGIQTSSQSAASEQAAAALSFATQTGASNKNVPIRVGSSGDNGDVSQANSVDSEANASNENSAEQSADQAQASGGGSGNCCTSGSTGVQASDQDAKSEQKAVAASKAEQSHPENTNVSVRVLSPGDNGDVKQTNSVDSEANASNSNAAEQSVDQEQSTGGGSGSCCKSGSTGIQIAGQDATSEQNAVAASAAKQDHPKNTNASIRVLSPGNDGRVEQTNSVDSEANAANTSSTEQSVDQERSTASGGKCCSSGTGIQVAGQQSKNEQAALGLSIATQKGASNSNTPIRVKSPGDNGRVEQTNSVDSEATAANASSSEQSVEQEQSAGGSCCHRGLGIQVAGQKASNEQHGAALSLASQEGASNKNKPVRVLSPGDEGDVVQSNRVESEANAANSNESEQSVNQEAAPGGHDMRKCCAGLGIQVSGQDSKSKQASLTASSAIQKGGRSECGCPDGGSNVHEPVRVKSPGKGGSVHQRNEVDAEAKSLNWNEAAQDATQTRSGGGAGLGVQAAGQSSRNAQLAAALAAAAQVSPSNASNPLRVWSWGDGGSTEQSNDAEGESASANRNGSRQSAHQAI